MVSKRMRKILLTFILFISWLFILPSSSATGEISVGLVVPLTGKLAPAGRAVKNGALMAVEEINQTGGIAGKRLKAVVADTSGTRAGASSAAKTLIEDSGVVALVGGCASSAALAVGFEAEEKQVPFLVTTAADDRITEMGWSNLFRLNSPASEYTGGLEKYLSGLVDKDSTAVVVFEPGPVGDYGLKRFYRLQGRLGFRTVSRVACDRTSGDLNRELLRIKETGPDIVCFICRAKKGALLLGRVKEAGIGASVLLAGTADLVAPIFGSVAGQAAQGLIGPAWWVPHVGYPGARTFRENFIRRYKVEPDHHSAQGYSGMWVIADAIDRAEKSDRAAIRASLEKTDLMTVYGPVKFEPYGHKMRQNRVPSLAVRWEKGWLRVVWPRNVAAGLSR